MKLPDTAEGEYLRAAPRAGAWIETADRCEGVKATQAAPRAGAWIET